MKILFITRRIDQQDALAGFSFTWIKKLAERLEKLEVICLEVGDLTGLPANCQVHSLGKEQGASRWQRFWRFQKLARSLVPQVDGVLAHQNPEYSLAVAWWCKLRKKRLIAWYTHKAVTWRLRLMVAVVDKVISASAESFRLKTNKLTILHHGIDVDFFSFRPKPVSGQLKLVSVSRLSPTKNIETIIEVAAQLFEEDQALGVDIYGAPAGQDGVKYLAKLQKMVADRQLGSVINFRGPAPYTQTPALYQQSDLLVNCSQTGSLDKAVLEAMACGTLVLTTNEAFKNFFKTLPVDLYASDRPMLVSKIKTLAGLANRQTLQSQLRQLIVKEHNLDDLLAKIIERFHA